ncbi:MAG: hypothetical protein ACKODT_07020 [Fluviibacter sp.]
MSDTNREQITRSVDVSLRDRIAAVICGMDALHAKQWSLDVADAVMEVITVHVPPIVASAIHGYADSQIVALDYHGDGSAIEEMRRLNNEAAQIANYATTHERWSGGKPA